MSTALKLRKIGNSVGLTIPADELARLNLGEGDQLFLTTEKDAFRLEIYDPEHARKVKAYELIAKRNRQALRGLAK